MNFAPYQETPEAARALSPPLTSPNRRSFSPFNGRTPSPIKANKSSPWQAAYYPIENVEDEGNGSAAGSRRGEGDVEAGRKARLSEFETSVPLRLDYEACLAYVALPPLGPALLLVVERKSDYVRFHAWQSALLFSAIFVVHLIFSWSSWISYTFLVMDILLIAYLVRKAYVDADTLDRCEVPLFGALASRILDDE